ncbi:MAG: YHYH protein [Phycisphaerales bacterium]|nr:YHYH protein [Phycisphaerales bacterium]
MRHPATLCASAAVLLIACVAAAHPPGESHDDHDHGHDHGHARIWTNVRTGERIHGSFLHARGGSVALDTVSGGIASIPLADLAGEDRTVAEARIEEIRAINEWRIAGAAIAIASVERVHPSSPMGTQDAARKPPQAAIFDAFGPFVKTRFDERWLYVESDGLPHPPLETTMMVGIRAWQQQVPLPQPYTGANAWQIPLKPELAERPILGKSALMRGAVALAANGIPIFNALNNGGRDSYQIGELDEYGGHCGRGDDYHYHVAPLAIEKVVGKGKPIAYALDGFPVYGLFDPKANRGQDLACPLGSTEPLDEINGHYCEVAKGDGLDGGTRSYHYHASKAFPYINGGLRGKVEIEGSGTDTQVVPQPRASGVRPALPPLRGASITGFEQVGPEAWSLRYEIAGRASLVNYRVEDGGKVIFEFVGPDGEKRVEEHMPRSRGGRADRPDGAGGPGGQPREGRGGAGGGQGGRQRGGAGARPHSPPAGASSGLVLSSAGVGANGALDAKYTCDGASVSPPFAWIGLPAGTKSVALTVHHITTDGLERIYLVRYGIPADATSIAEGDKAVGKFGLNNVGRRAEYAPPCSQGPGEKTYIASVYALSADPKLASETPTREELLAAIKGITLATGTLELRYARAEGAAGEGEDRGRSRGEGERSTLMARMTAFKTDVPQHDHSIVLVRPTRSAMTASVVASTPRIGFVEFWRDGEASRRTTSEQAMDKGQPSSFVMEGLVPDAMYRYRFGWRSGAGAAPEYGEEQSFDTVRSPGKPFLFAVQADSHLDQGVTPAAYERTLRNVLEERADFLVDLGDTFMTDKRGPEFTRAQAQYDAQRYWLGVACRSMPLFMVLGNHDGEKGESGTSAEDIGPWSYRERTSRFPAPVVDGSMYTGRTGFADGRGANYYAFRWGDAQCIVLDPFWSTTERRRGGGGGRGEGGRGEGGGGRAADGGAARGGDGARGGPGAGRADGEPLKPTDQSWSRTLGREQYDWLQRTLEQSDARYIFVFIHHLVGGVGGSESRGGVESVPFFEWGGLNADGSAGFAQHRPGWPMPIHEMLVKHGVSAVFHGHDHLYVHGQRDGIHYQCVPQPGNLAGNTRSASQYGYASGVIHGSPGHVRVHVTPSDAKVEFVRTAIDGPAGGDGRDGREVRAARGDDGRSRPAQPNGTVVDSYPIAPRRTSGADESAKKGAQ